VKIPILRIPFAESDKEFLRAGLEEILHSGMLTMGKFTRQFEEKFAAFTGSKYAVAVSNGTAALEIILRALEIEGSSVIVPTNTFLATAFSVIHSGNQVIFADSDPETLCLDAADVERRITRDTRAVILVHIGGVITPAVAALQQLCRERDLYLIEDCAHAHGCTLDGKPAGTFGVAGAFSFFPTKVLTTGEGGAITTHDEGVYRRALMIRNHGKNPDMANRMSEVGHNQRMSEFTALLGVQQLHKAPELVAERRRVAQFYDTALQGVEGIRPLTLPAPLFSTYYKYIAYLDPRFERVQVKRVMKERYSVSLTGEVYAELCHTEPVWDRFTYCGRRRSNGRVACERWPACGCDTPQKDFPGAEYISRHHICLPLYPGLTEAELTHVVDSLKETLAALGGN
jgi:dTDP-4-amino-4,6-dideoxygalactose transaminase